MRPEDCTATGLGLQASENMLLKGIVSATLRRGAVKIPAPGIGGKGVAIPLLDRVGRIRQDDVESHEVIRLNEFRLGEGIASLDAEVLDAVEEAIHPGNGGGHEIPLLSVELHIPPFLPVVPKVADAGKEHAAGTAGGVVDRLSWLDVEHLGHEVDDGAVRVELSGGVAGIVGEFLDQILVTLAQLILGEIRHGQLERGEVLNEVAEHGVGEAILIRPLGVAEDAHELRLVRRLNRPHGALEDAADIATGLPDFPPMSLGRDLESVILRKECKVLVPS